MTGRRRLPYAASTAVGVVVLGLAAAGCSGSTPDETPTPSEPEQVSAIQVCGGGLVSPAAGPSLERVLESSRFVIREDKENADVSSIAKALESAYRAGRKVGDTSIPACDISGAVKDVDSDRYYPTAYLRFRATSKDADVPDYMPGAKDAGTKGWAGFREYTVAFDCVSSRVGSTSGVPLRITAEFHSKWDKVRAGESALAPDYVALAHSAALAVAKELGCDARGGLPERPEGLPKAEPESGASPTPGAGAVPAG
ncbi:hypothetical protein ACIGBH_15200 [Streptomyces sp. NPDC085929]|uniref:hypothetical protein n=1 Tax=Streptomyces sp. NPDC085929 TaxID=3365739 RepID=UPI0037D0863A